MNKPEETIIENGDKLIVDACGGTGAWSEPYRLAGYRIKLVTSPQDIRFLNWFPLGIHGLLAAPPCTVFAASGARWERTKEEMLEGLLPLVVCLPIEIEIKKGNLNSKENLMDKSVRERLSKGSEKLLAAWDRDFHPGVVEASIEILEDYIKGQGFMVNVPVTFVGDVCRIIERCVFETEKGKENG